MPQPIRSPELHFDPNWRPLARPLYSLWTEQHRHRTRTWLPNLSPVLLLPITLQRHLPTFSGELHHPL